MKAEQETCTDNTDEKPATIKPEEPEEFKTVLEASPSISAFSSSRNTQMGEGVTLCLYLKFYALFMPRIDICP